MKKQIAKWIPILGRSCSILFHNMIPDNIDHHVSASYQHLLLLFPAFVYRKTQSETPNQGQAPSRATKTRSLPQQWDCNLGTNNATFTDRSHERMNRYSSIVTYKSWNRRFTNVGPPTSLRSTTPFDETGISVLVSYFWVMFIFIFVISFEQQWW